MTTKPSIGKRLLGAMLAVPMALAGMGIGATTAVAADTVPTNNLIAAYDFTTKPSDGKTVANSAPNATLGAAEVQNSADSLWADDALTLSGGAKTGTGDWVKLPSNLLSGKDAATVQLEVKADSSMLNAFHFLWNIGNDSSDTEYFFATLNCGSSRNPLVGLKSGGTETLVQSSSCVAKADQWLSVTATIDGTAAKLYIDGTQVASGTVPAKLSSVKDQSLNTIGRSPWPDNLFKGAVSNFRVYDAALTADQVAAISTADASIHAGELTGSVLNGIIVPTTVDDPFISLPTANGVTWASSDSSVIATDGTVNQPAKGEAAKTVTLTAAVTVRGQTATKEFTVTVNPTTKTAAEQLKEVAAGYVIPSVVRSGDALPAAVNGTTATVTSTKDVAVEDGKITIDGDEATTGTITVEFSKNGLAGIEPITKAFTVKVLPAAKSATIAAYDRNATGENEANNGDVAYSMHLALQNADGSYTPYNENYGIFFARSPKAQKLNENLDGNDYRSLKDPSLFRMADGTYGVISVRTNRGTATGDSTAKSSVLIATSEDLLTYSEQENSGSIVDLGETNGVNAPYAVYDTASKQYVVGWADDNGVAKYTTFDSLKGSTSKHGSVLYGSVAKSGVLAADGVQGIANFRSGATIAVDEATVKALNTRYGRSENTGTSNLTDITVKKGASIDEVTAQLPKNVDLTYSDGSTGSLPISSWNTEGIDLTKVGDYTVTGTVKQTEYQIPFAEDRADPSVYKWQWTHEADGKEVTETKFLMIASNDIQGDVTWQHGSPHMPFRMADTISGLADEPGNPNALIQSNGYNNKEVSLLKAGDKDSEGNAIMHSFWAPEIHEIDGRLTILFMAGYGNTWSNGKSVYMQLKQDADGHDLDPADPDNWTVPTPIYRNDASLLNGNKQLAATASGGVGMSLDMTYFQDADGRSYYAWQQLGATYIATMDPKDPAHVTSSPVRIVTPEYAWNAAIAEGPNVTLRDGKLYLMFSGSGVGKTYTTGLAVADASGTDLTDPASWTVLNYPIQKSGPFNGEMQLGTGHGMWSEDEDGNQIYVFHAYATKNLGSVNAAGRDMFVRRVHWAADGMPVFDMSSSEELASKTVSVTVKVVDDTVTVDKTDLSKALASAKQLRESDYAAASWKAFAAALASAEKVYADENASQKDVDDATAALNKAQAALVKVDGSDSGDGSSDSTKPGDGSSIDAGATGDKTGNKLGLSKTGAAVLGLSGVAVALAAAGIALTLQRKRQA